MKKGLITLTVLVMAFGNAGFAQRFGNIKPNEKEIVLRHFGLRNDDMKPMQAVCKTTENETYRYTYAYDEYEGYRTEMLLEMGYGNEWSPKERITFDYDFSGNLLEIIDYEWEDGDWMEAAMASYSYEGDVMEVVYQYIDNGVWHNSLKEVYNYSDDMTTILLWEWNGSNWMSRELHTYTYSDTSVDVLIQYMQGGAWQNDDHQVMALDFSGHVTEIVYQDWVNNAWVNDEKKTYNFEGDVYTSMRVENWTNGAWQEDYRFDFTYDDGNATHGECLKMVNGQAVPADEDIEMAYNYSAAVDEYNGCVVDVTYLDVTTVEESSQVSFTVYPSPAESEIQIQAENFQKAEIYSVTGQKLMESLRDRMNVSTLSSGLYIMKVYDHEGGCATQRFMVK